MPLEGVMGGFTLMGGAAAEERLCLLLVLTSSPPSALSVRRGPALSAVVDLVQSCGDITVNPQTSCSTTPRLLGAAPRALPAASVFPC